MSHPTLDELPAPPAGRTGWPWTTQSPQLPEARPDGSPWPKISVVTPSYEQGHYLEETIRSVLLQGYPNLEYVVIDGGSTDESVEIIEKYAPWIDDWVSEPDEGQSHAINKGIERCSGEIWNWINSDDFLLRGGLRALGEAPGGSDVLIGPIWVMNDEKARRCISDELTFLRLLRGKGDDGCIFQQQGVWLRLDQVKECGGIDESLYYAMDRDLYVRYTYHFPKLRYLSDALGIFRLQAESKTVNADKGVMRGHIRIAEKALESDMSHPELEEVCENRIKAIQWRFFVKDMRDNRHGKSRRARFVALALAMLRRPATRISRYSLGALRRILTS